ncbi:biotin--[acetyl-CoA-carboxylase] ligase [Acidithiobacillus ferridurans]|uniref:biotin--[acetyl-CoA-carboxylase] ligase n=1 Tax=Acidithiobacillus ferridurans TaxID=1232575 RepID=UPI001C074F24|nr:biotin--[acetyl-CoA-carboxylase] ligase [Acidithiobacillus ferridurans]MBU2733799.1 biotin--[acetyl-CoA-carboxylase] ligase [Acidithiobacillus ferridurans]
MAISAPEAPSAALQALLTTVADGLPHAWPADDSSGLPSALLAEAGEWGFPLYARDGGVQLEYPAAPLCAQEIADIGGIDPAHIHLPLCCASTNAEILQDAGMDVCLTESQWAGRGRRGRRWSSPFGRHLYLSYGWTQLRPVHAALTIVAALSVFTLLRARLPDLWIKWPNDLWVGGRKLGGILVEARPRRHEETRLVVGLGLNIHDDPGLPATAVSLADLDIRVTRSTLAGAILRQWREDFARFADEGFTPFLPLWEKADRLTGQPVQISDAQGVREARVLGLGPDGRLQVSCADTGTIWLSAGDVSLRPQHS